jgi:sterol desaturase/sphingolipid hydroxylase (fatty acid hydroxylase superfamily)
VRQEQMMLGLLVLLPLAIYEIIHRVQRRQHYPWREVGASLLVNVGQRAINLAFAGVIFGVAAVVYDHRIVTMPMNKPIHWIALFFVIEFVYYWFHRLSHEVRLLWTSHSVHHSANHMNFPAATRLGWTGLFTGVWAFWLPIIWLGFPPTYVFGMLAANLLYQYLLHTELVGKLHPKLEWFFNTPSHHRVHHGANVEYLDANYGGVVIIFDRLFGTFVEERADIKIRYGLVKPETSHNPFKIALGESATMLRDVWTAPTLKDQLQYVLGAPGYSHDGSGETTAMLRGESFGPNADVRWNLLVTVASLALVVGVAVLRS